MSPAPYHQTRTYPTAVSGPGGRSISGPEIGLMRGVGIVRGGDAPGPEVPPVWASGGGGHRPRGSWVSHCSRTSFRPSGSLQGKWPQGAHGLARADREQVSRQDSALWPWQWVNSERQGDHLGLGTGEGVETWSLQGRNPSQRATHSA